MKYLFYSMCVLGVALTVVPTGLKFYDGIADASFKQLMLAGAVLWFTGATFLIAGKKRN